MTPPALRHAGPDDAAAIGAVHVAAWRETYAGLLPAALLAALSAAARAEQWRGALLDPDASGTAVVVAEHGGQIIGFGAACDQLDAGLAAAGFGGEIAAVYVLRAHQRRGVGGMLIAALADALVARGHAAASLWVLRDNAVARAVYDRLGGEIVGEKHDVMGGATLVELAYGWRTLAPLNRRA
jgi:GNAT superfamily N-acetyltransferase